MSIRNFMNLIENEVSEERFVTILKSPEGEQFYSAYGPPVKVKADASHYHTAQVAARAGNNQIFGDSAAFWNSERASAEMTRKRMKGWTAEVMALADAPDLLP